MILRTMTARLPMPPLFGLTILIVDDDPVALRASRAVALKLGLAVECAQDGHRAVAALGAHRVDAVLLERNLPGLDGLGTTAAIRRLGTAWRGLPVIVLAEAPDALDATRCRGAGSDAYLAKPLAPAMLAGALLRLCRAPAAEAPTAREGFDPTGPGAAGRSRSAALAALGSDTGLETESAPGVSTAGR